MKGTFTYRGSIPALAGAMRKKGLFVAMVAAAAAIAGVAYAAVPDGNTINGCYAKINGQLRVTETAGNCGPSEVAISWNQQGPKGDKGDQGLPGPAGEQLWAHVARDGSLIRGAHVESVRRTRGVYQVFFDQDIRGCPWFTSVTDTIGRHEAVPVVHQGPSPDEATDRELFITVYDNLDSQVLVDRTFAVQVLC